MPVTVPSTGLPPPITGCRSSEIGLPLTDTDKGTVVVSASVLLRRTVQVPGAGLWMRGDPDGLPVAGC